MGTTRDALRAEGTGGVRLCYVVAIEGYLKLLTSHEDTAAVAAAWAGTEWSEAIAGLTVEDGLSQRIEPYSAELDVSSFSLRVLSEEFAQAVMATAAGNETLLADHLGPDDDEITVKSLATFDLSGSVYLGIEHATYAGVLAAPERFGFVERGRYAPFKAGSESSNRFGRVHRLASPGPGKVRQSVVTDAPRHWRGKWIGVWVHRIVGDTLDVKAQAECVFGGRVRDIQERTDGSIAIECDDARGALRDCVLFRDQFRARLREGLFIDTYDSFKIWQAVGSTISTASLAVVAGSPASTDEIQRGWYSVEELLAKLNAWVDSAGLASATWAFQRGTDRVIVSARFSGTNSFQARLTMPARIWRFLGWEVQGDADHQKKDEALSATNPTLGWTADLPPYRVVAYQGNTGAGHVLDLEDARGSWFDNAPHLPEPWRSKYAGSGGVWGLVQFAGTVALAEYISDEQLEIRILQDLAKQLLAPPPPSEMAIREGEDGEIEVKQIAWLSGSMAGVLLRLFATTDGSGYNGAYDDYAYGLGAAVPWELMGDGFENSLRSLPGADLPITMVLEKPVRLWSKLAAELILRNAWLCWRDGGLRFVTWASPAAAIAEHILTEDTKAVPASLEGGDRSPGEITGEWQANVVKVRYNRNIITGEYRSEWVLHDQASIDDYGESEHVEIDAENYTDASIEKIIAEFFSNAMPMFSRPLRRIERTIDTSLFFGVAPGDLCVLSDNDVRDPETGRRGVAGMPALIIGHEWDLGDAGDDGGQPRATTGRVILAMRADGGGAVGAYSPAARISSHTAGTAVVTCHAHWFTESHEPVDASFFQAGDKVRILEADPVGLALVVEREVVSVAGNDITFDSVIGSGGGGSVAERYIISRDYTTAQATQRVNAYQADDDDARIQDVRTPYEWAVQPLGQNAFTAWSPTDYPERPQGDFYGDGAPVTPWVHANHANLVNNLNQYAGAVQLPTLQKGSQNGRDAGWNLIQLMPFYLGRGNHPPGRARKLIVAPHMASGDGNTATVRVTLSLLQPIDFSAADGATFLGAHSQASFTRSSTTFAVVAAAELEAIRQSSTGYGWITIEATDNAELYGLAECRLTELR